MEYRVLGKLDVLRDGVSIDLGTRRQRAVLALMLTAPNTVWSTDRIIDGIWGDDVGADRQNALWVYVSGLRTALEPDRAKRTEGTILLTRSPGYLLDVDPGEVDAVRFERLVGEGRSLLEADPEAASLLLGEALSLWRGRAYEDFTYEAFAQNEIARLEELRLEAVEARVDADLLRGMSRELVSELETLVREHPVHERLTGQLMLALHRSGRQVESLRSYQSLRSRLAEMGVEPSAELRRLEERIVTGDETLTVVARHAATGAQPGLTVRGYELRDELGRRGSGVLYRAFQPSVGREVAIKVIRPELANDPGFIRRFEAEAQVVARLEHPHIVPLYDYWREPDAAYLVMRLMAGGTLAERLVRGALTPAQASLLAEQIGGALHAAHRAGVVHREVTATNVLFDDDGNAYLSDFGIAGSDEATDVADVEGFAALMTEAVTGMTGPVDRIRGALPPAVRHVVDRVTGDRADAVDIAAFVTELRDALGAPAAADAPPVDLENPYKGLRAFDGSDAPDFFGRERLVERLVARLADVSGRFVAVVGPSGSGKSSVVRAGLLPVVRAGGLTGDWFTVQMTPAPHPFESLEDALLGVAIDPPRSLLEELVDDEAGIARAVRRVLPDDGSRLLLVVDQFEELFTQVDTEVAERFIAALVDAVTDEHGLVSVVVTLRADFYDRPLRHRALGELLREGTEVITPMTPEELDRAITAPADRLGVEFERALVTDLVRDVVDRAGALPLLQYTLTELFDGRRGSRIPHALYGELGGVSGALVKRAEGLYAGLGDEARDVAHQVFLRLVTLGEGTGDTRRRVLRSELEQLAVERRLLDGVLETFGRHRLLGFDRDPVTRGPTVEISHEALLTEWVRLRSWIDAARHDVHNQRRLADAMGEWTSAGHSDEFLLRGGRLQQLEGWAATTSLPLSVPERRFLEASTSERDRVRAEERTREQRVASAEQRARRRIRQLTAMGVVAAMGAALAGFGIWQWRRARSASADLEALVRSTELVERSESALSRDPDVAIVLAVEAVRSTVDLGYVTEDAVDAVHWALQANRTPYGLRNSPVALRSGPGGRAGVYYLPPAELVAFAESSVDEGFRDRTCRAELDAPCSTAVIPSGSEPRFGADAYIAQTYGRAADLSGAVVTFAAAAGRTPGLERDLDRFESSTGIEVRIVKSPSNLDTWTPRQVAFYDDLGTTPLPDVLRVVDLDDFVELEDRIAPIDLGSYLDVEELDRNFGSYLMGLGTVAGSVDAVPIQMSVKGLVHFRPAAFEQAGYSEPATWDELTALVAQLADDGETPWCLGFAVEWSGTREPIGRSGWRGSDLLNDLVVRTAGVDTYDAWSRHDIPFDAPPIAEAGRLLEQLVFGDGFVADDVALLDPGDALAGLLRSDPRSAEPDPACWLYPQHLRLDDLRPSGGDIELDFFEMPAADPTVGPVTIGEAAFAVQLSDRPEVREFMEFLASRNWGVDQALEGSYIPPHRGFPISIYGRDLDGHASDLARRLATGVRSAREVDLWRIDASQVRPGEIGSWDQTVPSPAMFAGMIDLARGRRSIDEVLADVETAWTGLEAADDS